MRSIFLPLCALFAATALAEPCVTRSPVRLHGKYPIRDAIRLVDAKFDVTPGFANYRPETDRLELDLFDLRVNGRKQMRLGATIRVAGRSDQLGFLSNYVGDDEIEFIGSCGVDEHGNVVYANRKEDKIDGRLAVTEVAAAVDGDGNLATLQLTYPVGARQQTLCLKSATFAKPAKPDDDE